MVWATMMLLLQSQILADVITALAAARRIGDATIRQVRGSVRRRRRQKCRRSHRRALQVTLLEQIVGRSGVPQFALLMLRLPLRHGRIAPPLLMLLLLLLMMLLMRGRGGSGFHGTVFVGGEGKADAAAATVAIGEAV